MHNVKENLERCLNNLNLANIEYKISRKENGDIDTIILGDLIGTNSNIKRCENIDITYNLLANKTLIELDAGTESCYNNLVECLTKYELISEDKILVEVINGNCNKLTAVELFLRGTLDKLDDSVLEFLNGCNTDDIAYLKMLCNKYENYNDGVKDKIGVLELSLV